MNKSKFVRGYTADEHTLFSKYQSERARLRPPECNKGKKCWVIHGPPCYSTKGNLGNCTGCTGRIKEATNARTGYL
jgi:hypothetical protein